MRLVSFLEIRGSTRHLPAVFFTFAELSVLRLRFELSTPLNLCLTCLVLLTTFVMLSLGVGVLVPFVAFGMALRLLVKANETFLNGLLVVPLVVLLSGLLLMNSGLVVGVGVGVGGLSSSPVMLCPENLVLPRLVIIRLTALPKLVDEASMQETPRVCVVSSRVHGRCRTWFISRLMSIPESPPVIAVSMQVNG